MLANSLPPVFQFLLSCRTRQKFPIVRRQKEEFTRSSTFTGSKSGSRVCLPAFSCCDSRIVPDCRGVAASNADSTADPGREGTDLGLPPRCRVRAGQSAAQHFRGRCSLDVDLHTTPIYFFRTVRQPRVQRRPNSPRRREQTKVLIPVLSLTERGQAKSSSKPPSFQLEACLCPRNLLSWWGKLHYLIHLIHLVRHRATRLRGDESGALNYGSQVLRLEKRRLATSTADPENRTKSN